MIGIMTPSLCFASLACGWRYKGSQCRFDAFPLRHPYVVRHKDVIWKTMILMHCQHDFRNRSSSWESRWMQRSIQYHYLKLYTLVWHAIACVAPFFAFLKKGSNTSTYWCKCSSRTTFAVLSLSVWKLSYIIRLLSLLNWCHMTSLSLFDRLNWSTQISSLDHSFQDSC